MEEQWEYWTTVLHAQIDSTSVREFLKQEGYVSNEIPKFSPITLVPFLNEYGNKGWELLHMEPIAEQGVKGDIYFNGERAIMEQRLFLCFQTAQSMN